MHKFEKPLKMTVYNKNCMNLPSILKIAAQKIVALLMMKRKHCT